MHGAIDFTLLIPPTAQHDAAFYQLPDEVFNNPRPLAALQQVYEQRPEAIWQIIVALVRVPSVLGWSGGMHHGR